MWDLPRPGLEPVSPALAGRFSTTAPPGKPYHVFLKNEIKVIKKVMQDMKVHHKSELEKLRNKGTQLRKEEEKIDNFINKIGARRNTMTNNSL